MNGTYIKILNLSFELCNKFLGIFVTTWWTVQASNPGVCEIFRTRPDLPWSPLSLLHNRYGVIPRKKCALARCWQPIPPNAEVKEGVKLCLCSHSGPTWPVQGWILLLGFTVTYLGGGAHKSLAPPGRKQATATKFGICVTYSPRSSIHFLARCSNFCKPPKKVQKVVRATRSPRQQWPPRRRKNGELSIVFSVQRTGGSATGPDPENRMGDQDTGSQVGQFVQGCKCPLSRGIDVQEQDPLGDLPAAFFLQNVLQLHQQRWVILRNTRIYRTAYFWRR